MARHSRRSINMAYAVAPRDALLFPTMATIVVLHSPDLQPRRLAVVGVLAFLVGKTIARQPVSLGNPPLHLCPRDIPSCRVGCRGESNDGGLDRVLQRCRHPARDALEARCPSGLVSSNRSVSQGVLPSGIGRRARNRGAIVSGRRLELRRAPGPMGVMGGHSGGCIADGGQLNWPDDAWTTWC